MAYAQKSTEKKAADARTRRLGLALVLLVTFLFLAPVLAKLAGLLKPTRTVPWSVKMPKAMEQMRQGR